MPWDICILVYYLSICFRDTLLIFWWILESLSLCVYVCMEEREYLFLIFEIFARDYHWWIDVVQCYLHLGIVNIRTMAKMRAMKWERRNERYENYEWKNECLSILSVQIKSSRTRREFTHEFIYFVVRIGCAWPAQKWFAFKFFVFLLLPRPENWVAGTTMSILCYDRAQPMNVEITSFIMDSDQFALAGLKKQSLWFSYFSF